MARLLLCNFESDQRWSARADLEQAGHDVTCCTGAEALVEAAVRGRPAAVLYLLRAESKSDVAALELFRRAAPDVPLVLIATRGSLEIQREILGFRPTYYAVAPVDPEELLDAVAAATRHAGAHVDGHAGHARQRRHRK